VRASRGAIEPRAQVDRRHITTCSAACQRRLHDIPYGMDAGGKTLRCARRENSYRHLAATALFRSVRAHYHRRQYGVCRYRRATNGRWIFRRHCAHTRRASPAASLLEQCWFSMEERRLPATASGGLAEVAYITRRRMATFIPPVALIQSTHLAYHPASSAWALPLLFTARHACAYIARARRAPVSFTHYSTDAPTTSIPATNMWHGRTAGRAHHLRRVPPLWMLAQTWHALLRAAATAACRRCAKEELLT